MEEVLGVALDLTTEVGDGVQGEVDVGRGGEGDDESSLRLFEAHAGIPIAGPRRAIDEGGEVLFELSEQGDRRDRLGARIVAGFPASRVAALA